jgi:hypothetical protein
MPFLISTTRAAPKLKRILVCGIGREGSLQKHISPGT